MRMKKRISIVLVMVLLASAVPLAVTPAAAIYEYEWKIPCDDGDNELTKDELVNAILPYMLNEGAFTLDEVGDAAYVYAYWDGKPKTFTVSSDVPGQIATIYKPVERITVGGVCYLEQLRALNAQDTLVGVSGFTDPVYFAEFSKLPVIRPRGMWASAPNYEAVLSLHCDVFMPYSHGSAVGTPRYNLFQEKLPGVVVIPLAPSHPVDLETFTRDMGTLGDIVGKEEEAEEFIAWHDEILNTIESGTAGLSDDEKPRVLIERRRMGTYIAECDLVDVAGGINIAADQNVGGSWTVKLNSEWIIKESPDVILKYEKNGIGCHIDDPSEVISIRDEFLNREGWYNITAIREEKVYIISGGAYTASFHMIWLAYIAKRLHPEIFVDLNPEAIHQEYLTRFQGIDFDLDSHGVFAYPPIEIDGGLAGIPDKYKGQI
jgi:iron complex transport system substrate-binding protein